MMKLFEKYYLCLKFELHEFHNTKLRNVHTLLRWKENNEIMKWHHDCKYMELTRDYSVEELAKFHGHLGPFIVLGYRMGRYALKHFDNNPFALHATVSCSGQPPESCLIDGVQIGSGCTYGKRNIELLVSSEISVIFRHENGKAIMMKQGNYLSKQDKYQSHGDKEIALENFAEAMYSMSDGELFTIEEQ